MTDLRKSARGEPCRVRLPGVCNGNPDTSVLAHLRLAGITGVGMKAPDLLAAIACSACHDEIDGRTRHLERDFVKLCFFEGMARTQDWWIGQGVVTW